MRYIDLTEGPNDPHIFKAILLAGGPGAGKSTVSDRLGLQRKGLRVINSDDALEHLMRKGNLDFSMPDEEEPQRNIARDRAKQVAKTKERLALDGRLGLLIDGTAKDVEKTASVKKRLESYGYQVMMLFVDTSLRTALERNNMRPRRVPVNVVTKSHAEVQKNKDMLRNLFGTDFVEVNNEGTPDLSAVERKINSFLNAPISSVAKDWVSKQRVVQEDTLTESRPVGQYVYHATTRGSRPEQLIKSLISYGLRPSKQGYAGPGTYFAYEPDEGFYHLTPDEAVILRVKWDKLVKMYGVYPSNPDGIERDDEEIVVPGPVPSQIIEIELDPDHWVSLPVALRAVQARDADALMRESTPVDETLKKIKDRWALVSKHNPKKVLQYYKGSGHPSKEWVNKVERRVHAFEDVTPDQLKKVEDYADVLFNKVGIDVEFTRHFIDRVNDARNRKPITAAELVRLFREEYLKWGKPIARLGPDAEAVMRDMQTDVNMPFVLNWNRSTQQLELKAKTVMRKQDFKTPDPVFAVEAEQDTKTLTVYHGNQGGIDTDKLYMPMWFSSDYESVLHYTGGDGFVVVAELTPKKTLVIDKKSGIDINTAKENWRKLIAQGYDTIVQDYGDMQDWVVLDPNSIRVVDKISVDESVVNEDNRSPHIDFKTNLLNILKQKYPDTKFNLGDDRVESEDGELIVIADIADEGPYVGCFMWDVSTGPYKGALGLAIRQTTNQLLQANPGKKPALFVGGDNENPEAWEYIAKKLKYKLITDDNLSDVDEALSFPIPRNQMPQIDLEHVKHDFKTRRGTVSFSKLIPVQTERVPGLVDKSIDMILADKIDKPILVDQQGHIVNGHHRYDAYKKLGAKPDFPVPVIMIFATLEEIIDKYKHTASDDHVITPVTETTAGGIATVAMPLGGLQRRPNPSIYNHVAGAVRPRKKKK